MTELREVEKLEKPPIRHNWLYSVVPLFPIQGADFTGAPYLSGYCKQCRNYFTARLGVSEEIDEVYIEKLNIPVWGCEPVE